MPISANSQLKNCRSCWSGLSVAGCFVHGRVAGIVGIPISSQTRTLQMDLTRGGSLSLRLMQQAGPISQRRDDDPTLRHGISAARVGSP